MLLSPPDLMDLHVYRSTWAHDAIPVIRVRRTAARAFDVSTGCSVQHVSNTDHYHDASRILLSNRIPSRRGRRGIFEAFFWDPWGRANWAIFCCSEQTRTNLHGRTAVLVRWTRG